MAGYPDRIELEVASSANEPGSGAFVGPSAEPSAEPSAARVPVPLLALTALVVTAAALVGRAAPSRPRR